MKQALFIKNIRGSFAIQNQVEILQSAVVEYNQPDVTGKMRENPFDIQLIGESLTGGISIDDMQPIGALIVFDKEFAGWDDDYEAFLQCVRESRDPMYEEDTLVKFIDFDKSSNEEKQDFANAIASMNVGDREITAFALESLATYGITSSIIPLAIPKATTEQDPPIPAFVTDPVRNTSSIDYATENTQPSQVIKIQEDTQSQVEAGLAKEDTTSVSFTTEEILALKDICAALVKYNITAEGLVSLVNSFKLLSGNVTKLPDPEVPVTNTTDGPESDIDNVIEPLGTDNVAQTVTEPTVDNQEDPIVNSGISSDPSITDDIYSSLHSMDADETVPVIDPVIEPVPAASIEPEGIVSVPVTESANLPLIQKLALESANDMELFEKIVQNKNLLEPQTLYDSISFNLYEKLVNNKEIQNDRATESNREMRIFAM